MARLFPFRSETATEEGQPRVVDLEGEDADAVFSALSSTTARRIYARLDEEPGTPSDIADAVDSSIQNVRYHLENLEGAGLVEVVDTWYSSRGNEMSVYATTDGPLIVTSDESTATKLKEALSRLIGGVAVLAGGSMLVQYALTRWLAPTGTDDGGSQPAGDGETTAGAENGSSGGDVGISGVNGTEGASSGDTGAPDSALDSGNETVQNASDGGVEAAEAVFQTVPPGLLFFLGGLVVLLAVILYWYWYRPTY
ncbi:ArsR/SmtB family transcription factor [Natrinema soli]|uniref:ArsR/SmtB family transcription factor n=1 Tax=Natrinema soli TaxID=1930624 RepID=A0ABD5SUL9_9EURY|nr:helix-turn-helix domain-containing protein [Natrinema soli]